MHTNRLSREKSPYLLQHAHNPVDWYAWGAEAFEKARREKKPILLSIGYSTCHWCHVMEHESFEDERIAALMNRDFVSIKLDREERPDVDRLYMTAVQAMTGQGGWPLNVFLTPSLKPFFGGTYFPPDSRWGRPGFPQVLEQIAHAWKDQPEKIEESGAELMKALAQYNAVPAGTAGLDDVSFEAAVRDLAGSFDAAHGGFGGAPKFPMPVNHNLLLRCHLRLKDAEALRVSVETLRAMARGGIHDQLGGGFHRYSTDERWHVPHFEKMLYDNAQLAVNYLEAFQLTGDAELAATARATLDYVLRDLTHPEGGFLSAEDADSLPPGAPAGTPKREGAFYVWDMKEAAALLDGPAGELFCLRYGFRPDGNVESDPHNEFGAGNIPYQALPAEEAARRLGLSVAEALPLLEGARRKLFEARAARPRPHLDDKVLASWNGLALSALAKGAGILEEPRYLEAAVRAARFLEARLWDPTARRLWRRWRDGEAGMPGVADDYAFLAQGLLDLFEAGFDAHWLDWAEALGAELLARFYDADAGGFYMTAADQDAELLLRVKEAQDNVEPSASSVAALALARLSRLTGRADFAAAADKTLRLFADAMRRAPRALPQMLVALDFQRSAPSHVVIAGAPDAADTRALLRRARRRLRPHALLLLADGGAGQQRLAERLPFLKEMRPVDGKAAAYVCVELACRRPVTDPDELDTLT